MAASLVHVVVPLPRPSTSLIGREHELQHLYDLLQSDAALVTITGFGGMGKTRLSLQAALEVEPLFQAGANFVPLASVTLASSIPKAIAITAGLDESVDSVESLVEALGAHPRLMVLDNLEQIPDAAQLILQLLQHMPNITILATSRSRLEVGGEYVLSLEPLETESPDPRTLPAVQLFLERGRAVTHNLPIDDEAIAIIAEICQKLEGIPLAIELAAARLAIFSLPTLRDQLQPLLPVLAGNRADLPDRQRTMRNAIAWTFDLLEESERRFFLWLSVYEQDFSLESVAHVAYQLELTEDPLDLAQFLISRNLARQSRRDSDAPRFQMPQMLREFGHELLLSTKQDRQARYSHAMDMVALAEQAEPHLTTRELAQWMERLGADLPNIFGALAWAKNNQQHDVSLRIFGALWRYFENSGQVNNALMYTPDSSMETVDASVRARGLVGIGYLHERMRDLAPAQQALTEAVALAEPLQNQITHVQAMNGLGTVAFDYSDVPLAQAYFTKANELARQIGYTRGQLTSSGMLATAKWQFGEFEEALAGFREALKLADAEGDAVSIATINLNIALCQQGLNRYEEAEINLL